MSTVAGHDVSVLLSARAQGSVVKFAEPIRVIRRSPSSGSCRGRLIVESIVNVLSVSTVTLVTLWSLCICCRTCEPCSLRRTPPRVVAVCTWQGHADSHAPCELQVCWAPGVLGAVVHVQVQSLDWVLLAVYVDQARTAPREVSPDAFCRQYAGGIFSISYAS
jgi:hypothetical protein